MKDQRVMKLLSRRATGHNFGTHDISMLLFLGGIFMFLVGVVAHGLERGNVLPEWFLKAFGSAGLLIGTFGLLWNVALHAPADS